MAEPKAKTLQQKLGFFDEDLKSPKHDEILKWVDRNLHKIIEDLYPNLTGGWDRSYAEKLKHNAEKVVEIYLESLNKQILMFKERIFKAKNIGENKDENYQAKIDSQNINDIDVAISKLQVEINGLNNFGGLSLNNLPARDESKLIILKWEYPVTSQSTTSSSGYSTPKNIIGFIDLSAIFTYSKLYVTGIDFSEKKVTGEIKWTQITKDKYDDPLTQTLQIEVKTKISSLGELFRQLNTYKVYLGGDYIVICPDDKERDIIERQGFKFYKFREYPLL